jgi:ATP-dependent helicase/nuclease subunit A
MKLTSDQTRAVEAEGSIAVTAGAGTGKTAMLAKRFAHHVLVDGMSPINIVAATFTDKAAAELRSRIRSEMAKSGREDMAAEVDAAQISTIHALAARICRDFYHLAGIPADFRMIDETESAIRNTEWFRVAVIGIDREIIDKLGFSWLVQQMTKLFEDPMLATEAFEVDTNNWPSMIEEIREQALEDLRNCSEVATANEFLRQCSGSAGDKLEEARLRAVRFIDGLIAGERVDLAAAFDGFRANLGAAKNWPTGLQDMRDCIAALRDKCKIAQAAAQMEYGPAEIELADRLRFLKRAFFSVRAAVAEMKLREKVLDYSDLEFYALKVLEHDEAVAHYAERWMAIMIDEFQDTNPVQEKLIRKLATGVRLTVVGDEKQSIYGFRRADVDIFGRFKTDIGNLAELCHSFRTNSTLIAQMNSVFSPLLGDLHQELIAARVDEIEEAPVMSAARVIGEKHDRDFELRNAEANFIAREIRELIDRGTLIYDKQLGRTRPVRPGDIAMLSRTREPLDTYIDAVLRAGVPAVNTGGGNLLETRTAVDMLSVLRFASDPADDISLVAILRGPFFAISDSQLLELAARKNREVSWWQLIIDSGDTLAHVRKTLGQLLADARRLSPVDLLAAFDEATGYTAVIANLLQGDRRMADWNGMLDLLRRFESIGKGDLLGAIRYADELSAARAQIPQPPMDSGDAVSLMTIHGAKGLEWPVVFVPDLCRKKPGGGGGLAVDASLGVAFEVEMESEAAGGDPNVREYKSVKPSIYTLIKDRQQQREKEEAKRVLYVAITRARDRVVLTAAGDKGPDLELLTPGLSAAGIVIRDVRAVDIEPITAEPETSVRSADLIFQDGPVSLGLNTVPVTALTEYAICPAKFRYSYVEAHPGIGAGGAGARIVGTLTHTALELGIRDVDALLPFSQGVAQEHILEAVGLAAEYDQNAEFEPFRSGTLAKEVPLELEVNGLRLSGVADLVGGDYVLDYKTDAEPDPEHHRFQLWAYAAALKKPRAFIAYLRTGMLHEFTETDLAKVGNDVDRKAHGITTGHYTPDPAVEKCSRCPYSSICPASATAIG